MIVETPGSIGHRFQEGETPDSDGNCDRLRTYRKLGEWDQLFAGQARSACWCVTGSYRTMRQFVLIIFHNDASEKLVKRAGNSVGRRLSAIVVEIVNGILSIEDV